MWSQCCFPMISIALYYTVSTFSCAAASIQTEVHIPESIELYDPELIIDISTSSDHVQVMWYNRTRHWTGITNFTIFIVEEETRGQNSNHCAKQVYCSDPQCSFYSSDYCTGFDSCSEVIVQLTGHLDDSFSIELQENAIMAPVAPKDVSVKLSGSDVNITWTRPLTCELGSQLLVRVSEDLVNEYLPAPIDYYSYHYTSQPMGCNVGEVILSSVGENGESYTSLEFLLTEITTLEVEQTSKHEISVVWVRPSCAERMRVAWYDGEFTGEEITTSLSGYIISGITGYDQNVLVCVSPETQGSNSQWLAGEEVCLEVTEPISTVSSTAYSTTTTTTVATTTDDIKSTTASLGLSCYSCFDCPITSSTTAVIQDPNYNTCFTSLVTMELGSYVVRGGELDPRQDGECDKTDTAITCYCEDDLCNASEDIISHRT